jgi:hypothetical protein
MDPSLMICCQLDLSTLLLRGSIKAADLDIAKIKPLLGRMLLIATRFRKMLEESS